MLDFFLQLWCIYLLYHHTLWAICLSHPHFWISFLLFFCFSACLSVCLLVYSLSLSSPVDRFMTGVALDKPSSGIKRQGVRQALSHYADPLLLALIESSDPKLMPRGASAHLLSMADALQRQTSEQQWQCWIRFVGSDKPLHTLTFLEISHSVFAIVWKRYRLCSGYRYDSRCALAACRFLMLFCGSHFFATLLSSCG